MRTEKLTYRLASNKVQKGTCPQCNRAKKWQRYIDQDGNPLEIKYGRCDRESKCGYELSPYKDGYINENEPVKYKTELKRPRPQMYIPYEVLKTTIFNYDKNKFIQNLLHNIPYPLPKEDVSKVIGLYYLGTVPETGAVCFPFIDQDENVQSIQEKIFDKNNHTDKSQKYHTSWLHSRLKYTTYKNQPQPQWFKDYLTNDVIVTCFFGEQLLKRYPNNPIAIVESPKTAILCALYFGLPEKDNDIIWLSSFNLSGLTIKKLKVLTNRNVLLCPDLSKDGKTYRSWKEKGELAQKTIRGFKFKMYDILEHVSDEKGREDGCDIADYIEKIDWRAFRNITTASTPTPTLAPVPLNQDLYSQAVDDIFFNVSEQDWFEHVAALEQFFKLNPIPTAPMYIDRDLPANVPWAVINKCLQDCNRYGYTEQTLSLLISCQYMKLYII